MSEILLFIFLKNNAHNPFPSGLVYFSGVEDQVFIKTKIKYQKFFFNISQRFDEEYIRSRS